MALKPLPLPASARAGQRHTQFSSDRQRAEDTRPVPLDHSDSSGSRDLLRHRHDSEETWIPSQDPKSPRHLIAQFFMCHTELPPSFPFLCDCASFSLRKPHVYHMMAATGHQQREEGCWEVSYSGSHSSSKLWVVPSSC